MRLDRPALVVLSLLLVVGCGKRISPVASTTVVTSSVEVPADRPTGLTVPPVRELREKPPQDEAAADRPKKASPATRASFAGIALGRGVGTEPNPPRDVRPEPAFDPATDALEQFHAVDSIRRRLADKAAAVKDALVNPEVKAPGAYFINDRGEAWYTFSSPALLREAQELVGQEVASADANKRVADQVAARHAGAMSDREAGVDAGIPTPFATFANGLTGTLPRVRVDRIVNDREAVVSIDGPGPDPLDVGRQVCWLVTDTGGWSDGEYCSVEGTFKVTGRMRDAAVLGADRAVPLVESTATPPLQPAPERPRVRLPHPVKQVSWDIEFARDGVLTTETTGDSKYFAAIKARSTYADLGDDGFGHNVYGGVVVGLLDTDLAAYKDAWIDGDRKRMARMREDGIVWVTKEKMRVRYEYTRNGLAYIRIDGGIFDRRLVAVEARYVK